MGTAAEAAQYEHRARRVLEGLARVYESRGYHLSGQATHGAKSKIRGKSGYVHRIDVVLGLAHSDGTRAMLLAECKQWREKVKPSAVLAFQSRVVDIRGCYDGTIFPMIVSPSEWSKGVLLLTIYYGISRAIVNEDIETVRWNEVVSNTYLGRAVLRVTATLEANGIVIRGAQSSPADGWASCSLGSGQTTSVLAVSGPAGRCG